MRDPKIVVIHNKDYFDTRIFFRKTDCARYISHLDSYRTIQRAFQRSKLPVWYTDGFNPKIYLKFILPLCLGYEGVRESFDCRLSENLSEEEIVNRLNEVMPKGFRVLDAAAPKHKITSIVRADYTLSFFSETETPKALLSKMEAFLSKDQILTEKRSKKGPKMVDLKPSIQNPSLFADESAVTLTLSLPAGTVSNLNPTLLTDAFTQDTGIPLDFSLLRRDRLLMENGEEFC